LEEGEAVTKIPSGWKAYFPEDGESLSDAHEITVYDFQRVSDAEHAAELACEYDWGERDGWERSMGSEFIIIVISPNGEHSAFKAWNEASVDHNVSRAER
jgi:hypothetical protein